MQSLYKSIPVEVRRFLVKGAIVFIAWKLLYHLWLQPTQLVDKPLVNLIAAQTAWGLNIFHDGDPYGHAAVEHYHDLGDATKERYKGSVAWVTYRQKKILLIVPNCNALELMILYGGFILCFPAKAREKWKWIPAGFILIYIVNVIRCMALVSIANSKLSHYLDFAHHYLFTILVYGFIILLWILFIKKNSIHNPTTHAISE